VTMAVFLGDAVRSRRPKAQVATVMMALAAGELARGGRRLRYARGWSSGRVGKASPSRKQRQSPLGRVIGHAQLRTRREACIPSGTGTPRSRAPRGSKGCRRARASSEAEGSCPLLVTSLPAHGRSISQQQSGSCEGRELL